MSTPRHPANRLAGETSPYLRQHAHNPVDWFPWGDEAFAKAHAENKPVFLSVGYSACHWCHVMERESFENEAIADLLNRHYVSIKVDREERPDIDQIYMTAVQLITQRGGWPMSVFLTPEGQPFYGGTYWPPTSRMGMPGFQDILVKLYEYWVDRRDEVISSAAELVAAIGRVSLPEHGSAELSEQVLKNAERQLLRSADRREGGFGGAPKFPHPMDIRVLLRCWRRFDSTDALAVARLTLEKMADGGIYDHLGGGFHRYSTDARWLVPHFEKMLYDNALLVPAYLEMFQISGEQQFADVARQTLEYVLREMTAPDGGFFSTQDADSEGEEGKFFVWTVAEVEQILGVEDARLFKACYNVTAAGNWEGTNILHRPRSLQECAAELGIAGEELRQRLALARQKLFEARSRRIAPGRDEKRIVAWNGMMIAALSQAAEVLKESRYREAAVAAAEFLWNHIRNEQGRLWHSYKDGQARFNACLDDYACLIDGLTRLFESTGEPRFLDWSEQLADQMLAFYQDVERGDFFFTPHDHESLITRVKDAQDNATPSGNGMAATALLRLARLSGRDDYDEAGERILQAMSGLLVEHPRAAGQAVLALDIWLGPRVELVIVDGVSAGEEEAASLLREYHRQFLPHAVLMHHCGESEQDAPGREQNFKLFAGRPPQSQTMAYLCSGQSCLPPISEPAHLAQALRNPSSISDHHRP